MINLIFVGAGGFFLELLDYVKQDNIFDKNFILKGVLDDNLKSRTFDLPHLGIVSEYEPQKDDLFLIAIGSVLLRNRFFEILKSKNAAFYTYIHSTAYVASSAHIEEGCIIAPFSIINARALLKANVAVNVHCSVGHESVVGISSVLSPYSAINGNAKVGDLCFLGTRATVYPGVVVGSKSIIDSHSYVKSSVKSKSIVSSRGEYIVLNNRLMR